MKTLRSYRKCFRLLVADSFLAILVVMMAPSGGEAAEPMQPSDAFQVRLKNEKTIDVRELMKVEQESFGKLLARQEKSRQFLRFNHANGKPYLFVSRRSGKLVGPLAGRYDNGQPMFGVTYIYGNRHGALMCWDEKGRPVVYEHYKNGVRDGLRCIFKSCGESCQEGHLWLAEEWSGGRRVASHLRTATGQESSAGALNNQNPDYVAAMKGLGDFEVTLKKNEIQLKTSVVQLYEYEKQMAQLARARAIASMLASQRAYGAMPVCRTGGG
jgi:antitoxin component YwqK of YwqJK toxin-antitoxin module